MIFAADEIPIWMQISAALTPLTVMVGGIIGTWLKFRYDKDFALFKSESARDTALLIAGHATQTALLISENATKLAKVVTDNATEMARIMSDNTLKIAELNTAHNVAIASHIAEANARFVTMENDLKAMGERYEICRKAQEKHEIKLAELEKRPPVPLEV